MSTDNVIEAKGLKRRYMMGKEEVWALTGVDLNIRRGEYLSIMGPSGSGKSTLFNMIGGLDNPTEGDVTIDGVRTKDMNQKQIAFLRCKKIGYIFQTFNLIDVMTALENVMLPMTFGGVSDADAERHAASLLDEVGLKGRHDHLPKQLSGGQQQRVAVARSLANTPAILLADEPTGNLDLKTGEEIIALLGKLKADHGVTIICATHDHKMLAASDRVIYLEDGRVVDIKTRDQFTISFGEIDGQHT
ncbi:MAG: ABC transporter ATP-binding protein [bacterium]